MYDAASHVKGQSSHALLRGLDVGEEGYPGGGETTSGGGGGDRDDERMMK